MAQLADRRQEAGRKGVAIAAAGNATEANRTSASEALGGRSQGGAVPAPDAEARAQAERWARAFVNVIMTTLFKVFKANN